MPIDLVKPVLEAIRRPEDKEEARVQAERHELTDDGQHVEASSQSELEAGQREVEASQRELEPGQRELEATTGAEERQPAVAGDTFSSRT